MTALSKVEEMERIVHHVFLPPKLPQTADELSDLPLIQTTLQALKELRALLPGMAPSGPIENAVTVLKNLKAISLSGGHIDETILRGTLKSLPKGTSLAVMVSAQNAAILITREEESLMFEAFELSPQNEAVMTTKGRLIRNFPGVAVAVDAELLGKADFASMIASTLSTMSAQVVPDMQPQSRKAGQDHGEDRDTARPAMVTELLFGMLRGLGQAMAVSAIEKNTREEILWEQARTPWRRSPMWLLIRVVLQLVVSRTSGGSRSIYKEIMIFVTTYVLKSTQHFPAELLYALSAKIERKIHKLRSSHTIQEAVMSYANTVLHHTTSNISNCWLRIRQQDERRFNLSSLAQLNFELDTFVALPELDKYIESITSHRHEVTSTQFTPFSALITYDGDSLPRLSRNDSSDECYAAANLHQFEQWVAHDLDNWLLNHLQQDSCEKLAQLVEQYHALADALYRRNPEGISIMLLVIFELWIACDKAATRTSTLLGEFDPDIPQHVLQNLLLPQLEQMERLSRVEAYLNRRSNSPRESHGLFDLKSRESFATLYFDSSAHHRKLRSDIESRATADRQEKLLELQDKKARYAKLNAEYDAAAHEYRDVIVDNFTTPPEIESQHFPHCLKCFYAQERDRMSIRVHEWPLPKDDSEAKGVVFELQVPSWFGHWRDVRFYLLQNVLKGTRASAPTPSSYSLSSGDPHLRRHFDHTTSFHIGLLSESKPLHNTHYNNKTISGLDDSRVCVNNGLQYRYYDSSSNTYVGTTIFKDDVALSCTYRVPNDAMQRFLFRPSATPDGPEPNVVIASQDTAPGNMAQQEYLELSSIPLGRHIQWTNVLLQLVMPGVDFKKPETTLVILQCIYQAGPAGSNVLREPHQTFMHEREAANILEALGNALQRVKKNWESAEALRVFIAIAARALALSSSLVVESACLKFLQAARDVAMEWVSDLQEKAHAATDHSDRTVFVSRLAEVALICSSSFDVGDHHLTSLLGVPGNVSQLVQVSVIVHDASGKQSHSAVQHTQMLLLRLHRLLTRSYPLIAQSHAGLDDAVGKIWSAYTAGMSAWSTVPTAEHWVTTTTAAMEGLSLRVHYNILDGSLLVNGLPLHEAPKIYQDQPLYATLFGRAVVEVMPSPAPGFAFSTKRQFEGFTAHMRMFSSDESSPVVLSVQATAGGDTYETIPNHCLRAAYPEHFLKDFVHWYHPAADTVEFRPINKPWEPSSSQQWTLTRYSDQGTWQLTRAGCSLAGFDSSTSRQTSYMLGALARETAMHNIVQPGGDMLKVEVPTVRLSFFLGTGRSSLVSKEFQSMAVDEDQSLGCLIGLHNKLMLKSFENDERMVLVPQSIVSWSKKDDHVAVVISKASSYDVMALKVDGQLGRLVDSGDIGSKLYTAYLHALTSSCVPDPLTGKTGTEQALTILRSAAIRSFEQLSQNQLDLLALIADLSPGRQYYPDHKRVMQVVSWKPELSFLSQHGLFYTTVSSIVQQADRAKTFFATDSLKFPRLDKIDELLHQRDLIRASTFRVSGFGAEYHSKQYDGKYSARDGNLLSPRAENASIMSRLLFRETTSLHYPSLTSGKLWDVMRECEVIEGPAATVETSHIQFDASLVSDGLHATIRKLPALHRWMSSNMAEKKFSITMWLSTMSFASDARMDLLQTLAMVFKSAVTTQVAGPLADLFYPEWGTAAVGSEIKKAVLAVRSPFEKCPEFNIARDTNEHRHAYLIRRNRAWENASTSAIDSFVTVIKAQWPCRSPQAPTDSWPSARYINVQKAMTEVTKLFNAWHDNILLHNYVAKIAELTSAFDSLKIHLPTPVNPSPRTWSSVRGYISEIDLFLKPAPQILAATPVLDMPSRQTEARKSNNAAQVRSLVQALETQSNRSAYEIRYINELQSSVNALVERISAQPVDTVPPAGELSGHLDRCRDHVKDVYQLLVDSVSPVTYTRGIEQAQHWPRISPELFLKQLARNRWSTLSASWKSCIVRYGLALTALGRAERLIKLSPTAGEDILKELSNIGHQNWDPFDYPESLLIEVESGIIIREVQEQIAAEMRSPSSGQNAVMQLNMGEGKSSVIVPIVAAALADKTQLVRVIVAKPQSKQMAQMLISKLGGIVARRVYYMLFSRSLALGAAEARVVSDICSECMAAGGILLLQPEHVLSFQLMAPESYMNDKISAGSSLMQIQDFFDRKSRDIIDESDENFSPRFELIYTMGMQRPIDLTPDRWLIIQQVLRIVRDIAPKIAAELPSSLELMPSVAGSFPRMRILRPDAEEHLQHRLARHICENGLEGLQISRQSEEVREAVYTYITNLEPDSAEIAAVEQGPFWTDTTRSPLLLLRGLLAHGVLAFALWKRWRVHYGRASSNRSTRLAVPYRAKDSPSPRSEFSHPDVVITLTLLSYYYDGLTDEALFESMGDLVDSDHAENEYQSWIKDANGIQPEFEQLEGINLKDRPKCVSAVFPTVRWGKSTVDYFLSRRVFPIEMREFPNKLSASGWDIGKKKHLLTTGFSGTNDSRPLLPFDVHHLDLDEQRHTNALVLEYILQPENAVHLMLPAPASKSDAEHLLDVVLHFESPHQVVLDVGAQILEMDNLAVAKTWLKSHENSKEAAVFVNDEDELRVIDREGREELLQTSSFASRLDSCLVFLDEAHTRGIDLKLPTNYRAAVTLGANLTKDRLVQACMRMRKLGKGQSVTFCVSIEIQEKIKAQTLKSHSSDITTADVLLWAISETHIEVRRNMPLWAAQGERFVRQDKLIKEVQQDGHTSLTKEHAERLLEDEAQTIFERYRPRKALPIAKACLDTTDVERVRILERCKDFDRLLSSSTLEEEQERELSPEVEQERQVERPPSAEPAAHKLHTDVVAFAMTGVLKPGSAAWEPAFEALRYTSIADIFPISQLRGDSKLLVSEDFASTVLKLQTKDVYDAFQRPVHWLLTRCATHSSTVETVMVVSPYEANQLYVRMRSSTATALHIYKARTNMGYAPLDKLDLQTVSAHGTVPVVPRPIAVRLALFSGQLYIESYADYLDICDCLGLSSRIVTAEMSARGWDQDADGFIRKDDQGRTGGASGLSKSPVHFFKGLMSSIRRNGGSIGKTDVGSLLEGKLFKASDFDE